MSCGHWYSERRARTLGKRLGLPIVAVRRCTGLLLLEDGRKLRYDFTKKRLTPMYPLDPVSLLLTDDRGGSPASKPEGT